MPDVRSQIPGVDQLLLAPVFRRLLDRYPRARVVGHLRDVMDDTRLRLGRGEELDDLAAPIRYAREVERALRREEIPSLRQVINATGVVLHTNLGRAPLAWEAVEAMRRVALGYSNLEYDLAEGRRGSRYTHCVSLLAELTGAEDALVVNNAAAGLVLALNTLAQDRGVAVSRGELIEIGGGFRIPEILSRSGAQLREVGTTNKTRLADYLEAAEQGDVDVLLKVHRSNFRMTGFTEEVEVATLAGLAAERRVHLVYDLGTGLLVDPESLGLPHEPRVSEGIALGAHVVVVSGDKLLGGPQAGIVVGRTELIERMRRNPLCRALRVDKATIAALEATLRLYRDPERAIREIPVLRAIAATPQEVEARVRALVERLRERGVTVDEARGVSVVGGGTYPGAELPTWTLRVAPVEGTSAEALARAMRMGDPAVVGRVEGDRLVLDLRTVDPMDETPLLRRLREALAIG